MTRDQTIATLILHGWEPYVITPEGLGERWCMRNPGIGQTVGIWSDHSEGFAVASSLRPPDARDIEWSEIPKGKMAPLLASTIGLT